MNTTTEKKNRISGKRNNHEHVEFGELERQNLAGNWVLEYEIKNTLKANGFGSITLEPYQHPATRRWQYPVIQGNPKVIIEITSARTIYRPDTNHDDRSLINWMLNHPNVGVDGLEIDSVIAKSKKSNPEFRLYNVDMRDLTAFEEDNVIDQMVGRLSLDSGNNAVGLEKLRYILAELKMPFRDKRYIKNPSTEKSVLRNKLKNFVKKGSGNAKMVEKILRNLERAKKHYFVRFLIDEGYITIQNGMLVFNEEAILGPNVDAAIYQLEQDSDLYLLVQDKVHEVLKKRELEQE